MLVVKDLESWFEEEQYGKLGSLCGSEGVIGNRGNAQRVEQLFNTLVNGANPVSVSASEYLQQQYDKKETDQTLPPALLTPQAQLQDGDVSMAEWRVRRSMCCCSTS